MKTAEYTIKVASQDYLAQLPILIKAGAKLGISYTDLAELVQERVKLSAQEWDELLDAYEEAL